MNDPGRSERASSADEATQDVVGERRKLLAIGMLAVFVACSVFGALRLGVHWVTGKATPWWGNVGAAAMIALLYAWYRGAPERRSSVAVHGTALAATLALLVPAAYGMGSSKWWLSLVAFSVLLMGRRAEAIVWTLVTLVLLPLTAALEPRLLVLNAIGEPLMERVAAGFVYLALLLGVTWAFRRVVERRARELADTAASLLRANQVKSRFLAHMSHEIRTPLHGVIAMTDLAKTGEASLAVREQLDSAERSARALLSLLNNVLDVTRAEADAIELDRRPFALHALLGELLRPLAAQARAKGLELEAHADEGLVEARLGDRVRVGQILLNLVGNALKFTARGRIVVGLRRVEGAPDDVALEVADTGCGIPEDKLAAVFEPFAQASAADAQVQSGAGLGLAIVRELARCMGGNASVESELGRGSVFRVRLRLPRLEPGEDVLRAQGARSERGAAGPTELLSSDGELVAAAPVVATRTLRLLAAEDNPVNQQALRLMLARLGHTAVVVADGAQAWEALKRERFDALLTDVEMPGMDGVALTREVRAREAAEGRPAMPIIGATAHVGEAEHHRLLDAGMDEHLAKPFTLADLAIVLERTTRLTRLTRLTREAGLTRSAPPARHTPAPDTPDTPDTRAASSATRAVFDPQAVEELLGIGGDDRTNEELTVLAELSEQFRAEAARATRALREAYAKREPTAAAHAAHSLKGAALTLGFAQVASLARAIEVDARAGTLRGEIDDLDEIDVAAARAADALAAYTRHAREGASATTAGRA
jgi:signal transduction histidine kinase/CheY-like chemotaxis protein